MFPFMMVLFWVPIFDPQPCALEQNQSLLLRLPNKKQKELRIARTLSMSERILEQAKPAKLTSDASIFYRAFLLL